MPENLNDTGFLLQTLMEKIPDNIYFKDTESRIIMVNKAFSKWAGLPVSDIIGKTDFDLFSDAHAGQAFEDEQRIIRTGQPMVDAEEKETWPDGRITWVSTTKMPLIDDRGKIIGTFGISRDITDHKEAELRAAYYDDQVRNIKARMDEDVRMAGDLQKTFFPNTYPLFPADAENAVEFLHHYHASGIVSGDFCSIRKLSGTEAGLFLCDVMGHGVRAALVTALICAMIKEIASLERDPGQFLSRMNELLLPILQQEDMFVYATACYMVFDALTGSLRFANAGHPLPLLFPAGDDPPARWLSEDLSLRGPALAITSGSAYRTGECTIRPGDSVVMYTDGLFEVESPRGEEFGEEGLLSAAVPLGGKPLPELFPARIAAARDFAGQDGFHDDICLTGFTFRSFM
jgi:sigma-B regulation protein RsbU (phosphoserine phosphatase)